MWLAAAVEASADFAGASGTADASVDRTARPRCPRAPPSGVLAPRVLAGMRRAAARCRVHERGADAPQRGDGLLAALVRYGDAHEHRPLFDLALRDVRVDLP